MRRLFVMGLAFVLLQPGLPLTGLPDISPWSAPPAAAAARGKCLVCRVMEGEVEDEPIKATRVYQGQTYGFCTTKCAEAFDADPLAYLPPVFPRPLPAFVLTDLAGRAVSPDNLRGRPVLLDFWATWCAPCRKSMPGLQALHDRYADRGFMVLGVSIDKDGPEKVAKFIASKKITYPIALDAGQNPAWEALHVKAVPTAFLLDAQGQIVAQWTGAGAHAAAIEEKLLELLPAR